MSESILITNDAVVVRIMKAKKDMQSTTARLSSVRKCSDVFEPVDSCCERNQP